MPPAPPGIYDSLRRGFFRRTSLVTLPAFAAYEGRIVNLHLKLETQQPSGSFKDRGIGHYINTMCGNGISSSGSGRDGARISKLVSSSGGNAGYAVATAGRMLNMPVDVFVPSTTSPLMAHKIRSRGAEVIVGGANWNECDTRARASVEQAAGTSLYCMPFDHPLIWTGNSSIVMEIAHDLALALGKGTQADVVVCSVGGGGLLAGIMEGLRVVSGRGGQQREPHYMYDSSNYHWDVDSTLLVGVETAGAASFALAKKKGPGARLDRIDTIATTLGALEVTPAVLRNDVRTMSLVVSDAQALEAALAYPTLGQNVLVEPACGAALSVALSPSLLQRALAQARPRGGGEGGDVNVVVVVCGGSAVSVESLADMKTKLGI